MLRIFAAFLAWCLSAAQGQINALAATDEQWAITIDIAGRQRMLSQRMAKEILMVAYNLGSKSQVQASVDLFDQSLQDITHGNSALNILAAPSQKIRDSLQAVLAIWTPFKKLLLDNLDTIQNSAQSVKADIGNQIGTQSVSLLTKSNTAVVDLITFAQVSSAATATDVVNVASRQRMLIQKMAKEMLLVGLGLDFIKSLKGTSELFATSHEGIILGAPWAGVSTLTKVCTMSQMAKVSDQWKQFKPLVEGIVGAESKEESEAHALANVQSVLEKTDTFFTAMADAVKLFIGDDGSCNIVQDITLAQWGKLIGNVGKQRFLGMQVSQLYMQIILGVQPQSSQVELTVQSVATQSHIRTLIEGNIASNSPTAPTQDIMNKLRDAYAAWSDLKAEIDRIVNTGDWDDKAVGRVAQLGAQHLNIMNVATENYVKLAKQYVPSMNSEKVDIAGRQRMLFQKMSFEASLINYGKDGTASWEAFDSSVNLWLATHWDLLEGKAAYNISRTTNVCVVQKMKLAKDQFDLLHTAALSVANGNKDSINDVISINPVAFKEMNDAVGYYSSVDSITCSSASNSIEEWQAELIELGMLRALSQQVVSEMYLEMLFSKNNASASALNSFENTLKRVKFGDGSRNIPAPATQALLDSIFALGDTWPAFKAQLLAQSTDASDSSSLAMLTGVNEVIQQNMDAISDHLVFKKEINAMSNQLMLANRVVKEAAGQALKVGNIKEMQDTISSYEEVHSQLYNDANAIKERTGRTDLAANLDIVNSAWTELKEQVEVLASLSGTSLKQQMDLLMGTSNTSFGIGGASANQQERNLRDALQALTKAINETVLLYGIANPDDIPPTPPGLPWTLILYLCIGFGILMVCCLAVINAGACSWRKRGGAQDASKPGSWQVGANSAESKPEANQKKQQKPDQSTTVSNLPHKSATDLESASPPATSPPVAGGIKSL